MSKAKSIIYALLAATFYAINIPFSKLLLPHVGTTTMAALLYLGAGTGVGIISLFSRQEPEAKLERKDMPFVVGMILLDIAAPIFLMAGIRYGSSANASLLGNFEIVATTIIALVIFKEAVSKRLWAAILLITLSSILLSFEGTDSFRFSYGSLFVLLAAICWGFENNCTRNISSKSTYEIVVLKGIFSGLGSLVIAFLMREQAPRLPYIILHLPLCPRAEYAGRGKDKRLLRNRALYRGLSFLCLPRRASHRNVLNRAGSYDHGNPVSNL